MDENSVVLQANILLNELLSAYDEKYHSSTVVNSIYDTAWISMVLRKTEMPTAPEWAFPVCFDFLCLEQAEDGGWGNPFSLVERITCTFVCLLAIKKHLRISDNLSVKDQVDLQHRANRAIEFVHSNLASWELNALDTGLPIGLELWLPVVIEQLEKEGVSFAIPGKDRILKLRLEKLSRFPLEVLYRPSSLIQPSPLFTLEGFIGVVDFSKLRHQTVYGSMFSSPSSTAVYLMESPEWDPAAEDYLHHVVEQSIVKHNRCVPQLFPTSVFDIDWVLNIFVDSGLSLNNLDTHSVKTLGNMILQCLEKQDDILGADEIICPEPDSTAMALRTVYHSLGAHRSIQHMIDAFEGGDNYFTFSGERDPSVSSNAHVLQALNHSEYYATFATTQALVDYLVALSEERVESLSETLLGALIPLTLFQAVVRILLRQNPDGSWGSISLREDTSHAVITLKSAWSLPFISATLSQEIGQAIQKGQAFISANLDAPFNDYTWNGKCAYGLLAVSRAIALSALLETRPARRYSPKVESLYQLDMKLIVKRAEHLRKMRCFADLPAWIIEATCLEAVFLFRGSRQPTWLEKSVHLDEGFLIMLAAICIGLNYSKRAFLSNRILFGMLELMEFIYTIDPLIDEELSDRSPETLQLIEKLVHQVLADIHLPVGSDIQPTKKPVNGHQGETITLEICHGQIEIYKIVKAIEYGTKQIMENPHVEAASHYDRRNLLMELRYALLAQVEKLHVGASLASCHERGLNFYRWTQGSGADDTFSAVVLKLMICLVKSHLDTEICPNPTEKYLLEDFSRHAATWGRLWNDYADVERDRASSNLNVLDFPEFQSPCMEDGRDLSPDQLKRHYLADLIQHEEDLAEKALKKLTNAIQSREKHAQTETITVLHWYMDINRAFQELYYAKTIFTSHV
ncbi:hypothetical protein N7460_001533 [Penicillium canescens]|uniref:Uncharacterized protein n=1 Tax=Penicillium canescens TaxID=5083 RepID=A0AAD6NBS5_PENCN|nr:hypothetical protein N7460_001533 [Penicillium canescens]